MYEKAFFLEVITPDRSIFRGEATSLSAPGTNGGFQILYDHAPFLSTLEVGRMTIKNTDGSDFVIATSGGFVEVRRNRVVVLVEAAERADEIDVERARAARERAEQRLHMRDIQIDLARAELALMRARNRLRVAGKA